VTTQGDRIDALEGGLAALATSIETLGQRLANTPGGQCSASNPHQGGLVYMRGPNRYACQCGKLYEKSGAVLREVT